MVLVNPNFEEVSMNQYFKRLAMGGIVYIFIELRNNPNAVRMPSFFYHSYFLYVVIGIFIFLGYKFKYFDTSDDRSFEMNPEVKQEMILDLNQILKHNGHDHKLAKKTEDYIQIVQAAQISFRNIKMIRKYIGKESRTS